MSMPRDEIQEEMVEAWRAYMDGLEKSVQKLDEDIKEASQMADQCTSEWCEATQHVIDELSNSLFSISEPRWANDQDSKRLKSLKHRVYDLYANYRDVYTQVS